MTNDETQKLLQLRQFLIDFYKTLESPNGVSAVVRQAEVAPILTSAIKSIEELVKDNVTFA